MQKKTLVLKSPTGSGKTIMLISFIDQYLLNIKTSVSFIWLCPGKGNLEEQSRTQMQKFCPQMKNFSLSEALSCGFCGGGTTFINWEMVTKEGNKALTQGEHLNLFERIQEAHDNGIKFIIIVDEEHSNNTSKAQTVIDAFLPVHIIRVSATAHKTSKDDFLEIKEQDVIDAGLIAKAIYVNEDIQNGTIIKDKDEATFLIQKADKKRKEIKQEYQKLGLDINPLVVIQLPNAKAATKVHALKALQDLGYTCENGIVAIWLSGEKQNLENLKKENSPVCFLIMKQAIATGWDCPRSKLLVKLREGCAEDFDIQTIGRIRRQPQRKHYNNTLLDNCYVWTIDEKFTLGLSSEAADRIRLFLKDEDDIKNFTLQSQTKSKSYEGKATKEVCLSFIKHLEKKYNLEAGKNYLSGESNEIKLKSKGYIIGDQILRNTTKWTGCQLQDLQSNFFAQKIEVSFMANTHIYGIDLQHSTFVIHSAALVSYDNTKTILRNLFYAKGDEKYRFLALSLPALYAFIINNEHLLQQEFSELYEKEAAQQATVGTKQNTWCIPLQDTIPYNPHDKNKTPFDKNVYYGYTAQMLTTQGKIKSTCEILFERYCQGCPAIRWFYKNGDTGEDYFRIVYSNGQEQFYFYLDYIVMTKQGFPIIVEAKGGESYGHDKNIDKNVKNKFSSLKQYALSHNIAWCFVRDKDNLLYANNTQWQDDMQTTNWKNINDFIQATGLSAVQAGTGCF